MLAAVMPGTRWFRAGTSASIIGVRRSNPTDPEFVAVEARSADFSKTEPYRYARSLGAERYDSLPDRETQQAREPDLERHLELVERAARGGSLDPMLDGVDLTAAPDDAVAFARLPVELQIQRRTVPPDSTLAFVGDFNHDGRAFLLTSDFVWVPKDRVVPFRPTTFRGVALDDDVHLPLAFVREHDAPAFRMDATGKLVPTARIFPRLSCVGLSGRRAEMDGVTYLETRANGAWVLDADAVQPELRERTPWGARVGIPDDAPSRPRGHARWLEASVYGGWLVAYEDTRPVYVTLVSPGRGGAARSSAQHLETLSSTPLGQFAITGKFVTATMDGPHGDTHAEVPWVQNFFGAHALHAAYWHDAWGERVSDGCLNLSPEDAHWLFGFTEPVMPANWHGVRWSSALGPPTWVLVRR